MIRRLSLAAFLLLSVAPLVAQTPPGWRLRIDRSTSASDPDAAGAIKFTTLGSGFHAINPQAAVYWNPANTVSGNFTLKGTFTLQRPSSHTNYYGLVFGGSSLEGAGQDYTYFMVAQDGTWLLKRRAGNGTQEVAGRTLNAAVKRPGAGGMSVNALEVRVTGDKIDYAVNGAVVYSTPKSGVKTDGIYGFRVNHQLDVTVDGFGISKS